MRRSFELRKARNTGKNQEWARNSFKIDSKKQPMLDCKMSVEKESVRQDTSRFTQAEFDEKAAATDQLIPQPPEAEQAQPMSRMVSEVALAQKSFVQRIKMMNEHKFSAAVQRNRLFKASLQEHLQVAAEGSNHKAEPN